MAGLQFAAEEARAARGAQHDCARVLRPLRRPPRPTTQPHHRRRRLPRHANCTAQQTTPIVIVTSCNATSIFMGFHIPFADAMRIELSIFNGKSKAYRDRLSTY